MPGNITRPSSNGRVITGAGAEPDQRRLGGGSQPLEVHGASSPEFQLALTVRGVDPGMMRYRTAMHCLDTLLESWRPEETIHDAALEERREALEYLFEETRKAILSAAGEGGLSVLAAHALLDKIRIVRRMTTQLLKAARRTGVFLPEGAAMQAAENGIPGGKVATGETSMTTATVTNHKAAE